MTLTAPLQASPGPTSPTMAQANGPAATPASGTAITSDFTTFLKMLTTQMQNQDPLNPIDSTDYATQLATFSGVEQQVRTNQLLAGLASQFGLMGMAQLAGWVGQEARSAGPVWMDGDAVTLIPTAATGATRTVLVVKDAKGNTVARQDIPPNGAPYLWAGLDATGKALPKGAYQLSLENYAGDQPLPATKVESYARIIEARNTPDGVALVLEGGVQIPATEVTALRAR